MSIASTRLKVRVISYNILSPNLSSPDHFTTCNPEHLEGSNRLPKIISKLNSELSIDKPIFCLQEISQSWSGPLHSFFANNKYHFVTGLYGKKFNGYMGVGLAYPIERFETLNVDVSRLSDHRENGWPKKPEEETVSLINSILKSSVTLARKSIDLFLINPMRKILSSPQEEKAIDHWRVSGNRFNVLLFAQLKDLRSQSVFGVATYHMPCCYYAPMVMSIHSEMAVKRVQTLAQGIPFIFAGDFNILPQSSTYKMLTTGSIDHDDPTYPTPKYGMQWKCDIGDGVRSAYALSEGGEPDFTNYVKIKDDEDFIETLDYIFISSEWKVVGVKPIPHRKDVANAPFPNADEPSDHVLISSDFELCSE